MPPEKAARLIDEYRRLNTPTPVALKPADASDIDPEIQAMADADTNDVVNRRGRKQARE